MVNQIRVLNVNNLRNRLDAQGLSVSLLLGYIFVFLAGLIGFVIHNRLGLSWDLIVLTVGIPASAAYIGLFYVKVRYRFVYTLIVPALHFLAFRNKNKNTPCSVVSIEKDHLETEREYISVLRLLPQDIFLKSEDDKRSFNNQIKSLLNNLRGMSMHLKVVCRTAYANDYQEYFDSSVNDKGAQDSFTIHKSELEEKFENGDFDTKDFYLIVSQKKNKDTEIDLRQLKQKSERLKDNFEKAGIGVRRLSSKKLRSFEKTYINGAIKGKEGSFNYAWDSFSSGKSEHSTVYSLSELPVHIDPKQVYRLLNLNLNIVFDYHLQDTDKRHVQGRARERIATIEEEQRARLKRGGLRSKVQDQELSEIQNFDELLAQGVEKPFLVSIHATVSASSKAELDEANSYFLEASRDIGLGFSPEIFNQEKALSAILPNGSRPQTTRLLSTSVTSYLLPFVSKKVHHKHGVFLGSNYYDNSPILFNLFSEQNYNMNIMGASGGGKSVWTKSQIARTRFLGFKTIILDPENEYLDLTNKLDGKVMEVSKENGINPFGISNLNKEAIEEQTEILKQFFSQYIYPNHFENGAELGADILKFYQGITNKRIKKSSMHLEGFLDYLKSRKRHPKYLPDIEALRVGREYGGYFSNKELLKIDSEITCFALKSLISSDTVLNSAMLLISKSIQNIASTKSDRILLYVDEAHLFLNKKYSSQFLLAFAKTARKYRMGLVCISQNVQDWNEENGGAEILRIAQTNIILKQTSASIKAMQNLGVFSLSADEEELLKNTTEPGVGIIYRENEHIAIQYEVLPYEWEFVSTTNEEDKLLREIEYD